MRRGDRELAVLLRSDEQRRQLAPREPGRDLGLLVLLERGRLLLRRDRLREDHRARALERGARDLEVDVRLLPLRAEVGDVTARDREQRRPVRPSSSFTRAATGSLQPAEAVRAFPSLISFYAGACFVSVRVSLSTVRP